jgi:hypothetical protein
MPQIVIAINIVYIVDNVTRKSAINNVLWVSFCQEGSVRSTAQCVLYYDPYHCIRVYNHYGGTLEDQTYNTAVEHSSFR